MLVATSLIITPTKKSLGTLGQCLIALAAFECAYAGFRVQRMMLRAKGQSLTSKLKSTELGRWRAGNVIRLATASAVGQWGILLHFLGGSIILVRLLFLSSLFLLLIWKSGTAPVEIKSTVS